MVYSVKEIYYTLQGEGAQTGRAAVFCRFTGCNLWSGLARDRTKAQCDFCDTDFVGTDGPGGGQFNNAKSLARAVGGQWPSDAEGAPYVICTGGEPLLQLDQPLIEALHDEGLEVGLETNGTLAAPEGVDWICVSPKARTELVQRSGQEIKLIFPQEGLDPALFSALPFNHFFLQPMDGPRIQSNIKAVTDYCLTHPKWRMSLQTHKLVGLP